MESYFDIINTDVLNIIVSYLDIDTLEIFYNEYNLKLNWDTIYLYQFNTYKNVDYFDYMKHLGLRVLKKEFVLNVNINEIINLKKMNLSALYMSKVPKEIKYLTNLEVLFLDANDLVQIPINDFELKSSKSINSPRRINP